MATLSGVLLSAFVDSFVTTSSSLPLHAFNRGTIARAVFKAASCPEARLAKCCSPDNDRHLNEICLGEILDACRRCLESQFRRNHVPVPAEEVAAIERVICRQLGLTSAERAQASDFYLEKRFETATTAAEFGVPDVMAWEESSFSFSDRLAKTQQRSVEVMRYLAPRIAYVDDPRRRLDLLGVALSIAALNHPGTRWFEPMHEGALRAADKAELHYLTTGYRVSPELRRYALLQLIDLYCLPFLPTQHSPSNALHYVLQGQRIPESHWQKIQRDVRRTLQATEELLELDPESERAHLCRAAYLSQSARLLIAAGSDARRCEANVLAKQARVHAERCSYPEGLIYPVQYNVALRKYPAAVRSCQMAVELLEGLGRHAAATAFAALLIQLTRVYGHGITTDEGVRRLAREAVSNPSTRYQYSHIFDFRVVRKLLGPGRPPRSTHT